MASQPVPQATVARERRTRTPDWMTNVILAISTLFGAWGIGLIVLTALAIVQPAFLYSDDKAALKVAGSTVVAILAVAQTYTMHSAMGHLPRGGLKIRQLMVGHRYGGRIAVVLAAFIAFFCMTDLGAPTSPLRVGVHAFFAATAFTAIAVKLALIRFRPHLAYDLAPWLGTYAAFAFVVVWISSAVAYMLGDLG
jgi:uncharacterized protein DUF6529